MSPYKLIVFDVDGTLSTPDSGKLHSDTKNYFETLKTVYSDGNGPKIALAANQGGVGLRHWMEVKGFGEPKEYPTQKKAEDHINGVAREIEKLYEKPDVYISFAYQSKKGPWSPTPKDQKNDPRWKRDWRKPKPGMLLAAMTAAEVTPEETLMVSDDGPETAENAGCHYMWAHEFFQRPEPTPFEKTKGKKKPQRTPRKATLQVNKKSSSGGWLVPGLFLLACSLCSLAVYLGRI